VRARPTRNAPGRPLSQPPTAATPPRLVSKGHALRGGKAQRGHLVGRGITRKATPKKPSLQERKHPQQHPHKHTLDATRRPPAPGRPRLDRRGYVNNTTSAKIARRYPGQKKGATKLTRRNKRQQTCSGATQPGQKSRAGTRTQTPKLEQTCTQTGPQQTPGEEKGEAGERKEESMPKREPNTPREGKKKLAKEPSKTGQ
jgi:hypothetical protein